MAKVVISALKVGSGTFLKGRKFCKDAFKKNKNLQGPKLDIFTRTKCIFKPPIYLLVILVVQCNNLLIHLTIYCRKKILKEFFVKT